MVSRECVIPHWQVIMMSILVSTGVQVQLQEKLLSQEMKTLKPDLHFLELLADVVDSKWPCLASILSLTNEMEEVKREGEGLPQHDHALIMLKKWAARDDATYGQLYQRLNIITLF